MTTEQDKLFPLSGNINLMLMSISVILMTFLGTSELTEEIGNWYAILGVFSFILIMFSFQGNRYDVRLKTHPSTIIGYIVIGIGNSVFFILLNIYFFEQLNYNITHNPLVMFVLVVIEEMLFRIALPRFLFMILGLESNFVNWIPVILISNILFGVFHAVAYNLVIESMVLAVFGGIIQSVAYYVMIKKDTRGEYVLAGLGLSHFLHNWGFYNPVEAITLTMIGLSIIVLFALVQLRSRR